MKESASFPILKAGFLSKEFRYDMEHDVFFLGGFSKLDEYFL